MNHIPATVLAAIDTIAAGLAKQRKVSFNKELDMCAYRSEDGCKCAIGMIFPEDLYSEHLEGLGADGLIAISPAGAWVESLQGDSTADKLSAALSTFQSFHDSPLLTNATNYGPTYKWLLDVHANDPDEMLEASIKKALISRAEEVYEVTHEPA